VKDVHIVWLTAGLSCDGDSVSITAATQPSVEDVVLGAIPGLPAVHLHNPVLAYENGGEFLDFFFKAERGELDPFVLVVEGSIPNEKIKAEGYWAAMGYDEATGQPITTCEWIDAEHAPLTAASTRWRAIRQALWGLRTTSGGIGNRPRAFRS
jgi:hydrogenase small subunit